MQPLTKHDPRDIGPYRLTGRLGTGGMGTVYAARDAGGTALAVKVVHDEYSGERDFRTRFAREVDLMRRVHSPLLPRFHDADPAAARPWLATELIPGHTLADYVHRHGPLTGGRLFAFAAAAAEALGVVHGSGVVHRDLKPGNVILAARGPVLLDFGIARAAEQTAMTRTGMVLGTPGWVSPEQFQGHPADARSDMFAWGALLAYAAAGKPPFTEGGAAGLVHQAGMVAPDLQALPPGLRPVAAAALDARPERRPDAVQALQAVHGAWQGGTVAEYRSEMTAALLAEEWPGLEVPAVPAPPRRRRGLVMAAAGVLVLAVLGASAMVVLRPDGLGSDAPVGEEPEAAAAGTDDAAQDDAGEEDGSEAPHAYHDEEWPQGLAVDTAEHGAWQARAELREVDEESAAMFPGREVGTLYAYFEHTHEDGDHAAIAVFDMMSTPNGVESGSYVLPASTVPVTGEMLVVNHGEQRYTSGRFEGAEGAETPVEVAGHYAIPSRDPALLTFEGPEYHHEGVGAPPVSVCAVPGERIGTEDGWDVDYGPGQGFTLDYADCT